MTDEQRNKEDLINELISLRQENLGLKDSKNIVLARSLVERNALMESLQESEDLLNLAFLTAGVGVWSWTSQNSHLIVSANWKSILGIPEEKEVSFETWSDALHPDDREHAINELNAASEQHRELDVEYRVVWPDGTVRWIVDRGRVFCDEKGRLVSMSGVNVDITERKRSEKSTQLSRLYNVLSKINEAIVRVREPQKLFEETCRVAVEDGQFRLAWIGLADPDTKLIKVVAKYGYDEGYLDNVRISVDKDTPEGQGPTGIALREGLVFVNNDTENNPEMRPWRDEQLKRGYRASASFPFIIENQTIGVITLYANRTNYFDEEEIQLLQSLADDVSFAIESADIVRQRKEIEKEMARLERLNLISEMAVSMSSRFEEKLQTVTEETRQELVRFKEAFSRAVGLEKIVINSESMKKTFLLAAKMHEDRKLPVLIEGETGTGKEVIAKYIHYGNGNVTTPFIALNCAAIAPSIFESELFGYEAGAFTGGLSKGQKGKLDMAKGGTLFLDEITELPLDLQAKLLRVLQENEYFRVGGQKILRTDVRIICATNQKIEDMVAEGKFRRDLYYRLNVGRIHLPPLRERVEDILPLAYSFLTAFAEEKGSQFRAINQEAGIILEAYEWPGNVREIRNAMQRVVLLWDGWEVKPQYLDFLHNSKPSSQLENGKNPATLDLNDIVLPADKLPIEDVYNAIVSKALVFNNGNKTKTAQYLQISRNSLIYRLKQMNQDDT